MINGISLFSSAGIAELYLKDIGINIVVGNELIEKRAELHEFLYPSCKMFKGDISNEKIFQNLDTECKSKNCKFLLATPPCQGMSSLGKKDYSKDKRNYLVFYAFDLIDDNDFDFILIENVPKFLKLYFPYENDFKLLVDICKSKYGNKYNVDSFVLNAKDYGVPQSRPRGFIRIWKKNLVWNKPVPQKEITLRECIGDLPSLNPGESSQLKWHFAKQHNNREVLAMSHTPEGQSALKNKVYYPKKSNGEPIKGFHNTYKRMKWDEPCPARAMNNGNLGGHNNCHPGRILFDGTYSDPRVLTLRELFIVSSINPNWELPNWCTDNFIRQVIGEAIPPLFAKNILGGMKHD